MTKIAPRLTEWRLALTNAESLDWRLYRRQWIILGLLGMLFWGIQNYMGLAVRLAHFSFDPTKVRFPLKTNVWLELINHRLAKYLVIGITVYLLISGLFRSDIRLIVAVRAIAMATLFVFVPKEVSPHSCSWDLQIFGGTAEL